MNVKKYLCIWVGYVLFSWSSSVAIVWSGIAEQGELLRTLPVIAKAEVFFNEQGRMDFLKTTAWIYEKDFLLLLGMLGWLCFVYSRHFGMRFSAFFSVRHYRQNYPALLILLVCLWHVLSELWGPTVGAVPQGLFGNRLYGMSIPFGMLYQTMLLPAVFVLIALSLQGFLDRGPLMGKDT
ncbi:hypothetical protein [Pseudomonas sp. CAM1A]|uniref:hypothetical protein n=1 Tax=Pseudomonas sp. CAM1A TaxID=3231717 RepID=UPI0039C6C967